MKKHKKRVTQKMIDQFIKNELDIKVWKEEDIEYYASKMDGSFLTFTNLISDYKWMIRLGLSKLQSTHEVVNMESCQVGWCESEQKWYGWSHRAVYGFGIGSECKKGDCAYVDNTPQGLIDSRNEFFDDVGGCNDTMTPLPDGSGILVIPAGFEIPMASSVEEAVKSLDDDTMELPIERVMTETYEIKCGRGEWVAKTLDDAKQMAIDFAKGIS